MGLECLYGSTLLCQASQRCRYSRDMGFGVSGCGGGGGSTTMGLGFGVWGLGLGVLGWSRVGLQTGKCLCLDVGGCLVLRFILE